MKSAAFNAMFTCFFYLFSFFYFLFSFSFFDDCCITLSYKKLYHSFREPRIIKHYDNSTSRNDTWKRSFSRQWEITSINANGKYQLTKVFKLSPKVTFMSTLYKTSSNLISAEMRDDFHDYLFVDYLLIMTFMIIYYVFSLILLIIKFETDLKMYIEVTKCLL